MARCLCLDRTKEFGGSNVLMQPMGEINLFLTRCESPIRDDSLRLCHLNAILNRHGLI